MNVPPVTLTVPPATLNVCVEYVFSLTPVAVKVPPLILSVAVPEFLTHLYAALIVAFVIVTDPELECIPYLLALLQFIVAPLIVNSADEAVLVIVEEDDAEIVPLPQIVKIPLLFHFNCFTI